MNDQTDFVSHVVAERLLNHARNGMDEWLLDLIRSMPPSPPLSRWQKLRNRFHYWRVDRWGAVHDFMFPNCRGDDDY